MREGPPPERAWRAFARGLAMLVVLIAARAAADGPVQVLCQAEQIGGWARVQVTALDLFDRDLLRLVRLGLDGRIALDVTLYRRRPLWFDRLQGRESRAAVVTWSRSRRSYSLDEQPLPDPARLALVPVVLRAQGEGEQYVEISIRLEVVTAGSLVQVARWLVRGQGSEEGPTPSVLGRSLLSQVASDLARSATARCPLR
jgi:hypothetical protein